MSASEMGDETDRNADAGAAQIASPAQRRVFAAFAALTGVDGTPPPLAEVAGALGVTRQAVHQTMRELVALGLVAAEPRGKRTAYRVALAAVAPAPAAPAATAALPLEPTDGWYLECYRTWAAHYGRGPSVAELARYCSRSPTAVHRALCKIEAAGHLRRDHRRRFIPIEGA